MNWRVVTIWVAKILFALLVLWLGHRWVGEFDQIYATGDPYAVLNSFFKYILMGAIVIAIFFFDIVTGLGDRFSNFIMPQMDNVEVRPEYSTAEARAREGRYKEAIVEFRKVWEKYPNDVNAHVRIAEIQSRQFQRFDEAVRELHAGLAKSNKPEQWAFVANRLVDIHVECLHDFVAARETLQQTIIKFPNTKFAEAATARVLALNDKEIHQSQPARGPLKVRESTDEQV